MNDHDELWHRPDDLYLFASTEADVPALFANYDGQIVNPNWSYHVIPRGYSYFLMNKQRVTELMINAGLGGSPTALDEVTQAPDPLIRLDWSHGH